MVIEISIEIGMNFFGVWKCEIGMIFQMKIEIVLKSKGQNWNRNWNRNKFWSKMIYFAQKICNKDENKICNTSTDTCSIDTFQFQTQYDLTNVNCEYDLCMFNAWIFRVVFNSVSSYYFPKTDLSLKSAHCPVFHSTSALL